MKNAPLNNYTIKEDKLTFPSPCGEKVMKNPILTETLLHLAFKGHLRQATETKM